MPHPPQLALHRPAHNLNSLPLLDLTASSRGTSPILWSMPISSIESSSTPAECPVFQYSTGSTSASIFGVSPHGITLNWPLCRRSIFGTVDPHTSPLRPTFTRWICQLLGKILFLQTAIKLLTKGNSHRDWWAATKLTLGLVA